MSIVSGILLKKELLPMGNKILVIGSINVDNVFYTKNMPEPGKSVFGDSFLSNIGGKGANQACASFFLNGDVHFVGAIGDDNNGKWVASFLKEQKLPMTLLTKETSTGCATITIDKLTAENQILVVLGANLKINKDDIDTLDDRFNESKYLLVQLENDIDTVCYAIKKAKEKGLITILNPAPYHELPDDIYPFIDYFVPNEHELDGFIQEKISVEDKCHRLLNKGVSNIIVTLGEKGSFFMNRKESFYIPSRKVKAIDTTGAGDTYLGAFVTALSQGKNSKEAMEFATLASSITVTRKGAILSLPHLEDLSKTP